MRIQKYVIIFTLILSIGFMACAKNSDSDDNTIDNATQPGPTLSAISFNKTVTIDKAFNKDTLKYNVRVNNDVDTISVTASLSDSTNTYVMKLNDAEVSGENLGLALGINVLTVDVSAAKRSSITYTFNISRAYANAKADNTEITSFGSNPGNLKMYVYTPSNAHANSGLVVLLHGCNQDNVELKDGTNWNALAEEYKFYIVYAEQKTDNDTSRCFTWFEQTDSTRDSGEALSIKNMAQYVIDNTPYGSIDTDKVAVAGMSAGGAMTNVMLATYPDVFKAGAVLEGIPYKGYTLAKTWVGYEGYQIMFRYTGTWGMNGDADFANTSAATWGDLVRNASTHTTYPRIMFVQGVDSDTATNGFLNASNYALDTNDNFKTSYNGDIIVQERNLRDNICQWSNVHGIDTTADSSETLAGTTKVIKETHVKDNTTVIETYMVLGMGHYIAVDDGHALGTTADKVLYSTTDIDGFHSPYWATKFFGLIGETITATK